LLDPPPDAELVRVLLREQAPELADERVLQLPGGRDNAAFRVGHEHIARLPLHPAAAPLMRNEQRWLPALSMGLPVATSSPVVKGEPGCGYPFPWAVARWIPGDTADRSAYRRGEAADTLLAFWRGLHQPAPESAPDNPFRSVPLAQKLPPLPEHLEALKHPRAAAIVEEFTRIAALPTPPTPKLWCHGDLHPRNMVINDGQLVGVIDWGDLFAGDPVVDYAAAWMMLPGNQVERVRRALHAEDDTWNRARGWALFFGVLLMRIGAKDGVPEFFRAGSLTIDRAMSWTAD
jgi:aminoglycoside phosphotransferase (APT) family kinase protein